MSKGRKANKGNLLIAADAGVNTGFATVTHNLIEQLHTRWNINVIAINYHGDPHPIQKKAQLWNPAAVINDDLYGFSRIDILANNTKADVLLVINDPWIAAEYVPYIKDLNVKKILYTPVDAKNIKPMFVERINEGFDHVIAYTQFGADELVKSGLTLPYSVIPHGVSKKDYFPIDRAIAREQAGIDPNFYIVQVVDRNQIRKRLDLAIYYFAQWIKNTNKPDNVMFYYHGALRDDGWDIGELMTYNGISKRLILSHQDLNPSHGFPTEYMKIVYSLADVKLSTTLGEGWGLTTMESMACGIPNIVPKYSALGEWANGGVEYIDIATEPYFTPRGLNTHGGIAQMNSTIIALETLYKNDQKRRELGKKGLELVSRPEFQWKNIAERFEHVFTITTVRTTEDNVDDD